MSVCKTSPHCWMMLGKLRFVLPLIYVFFPINGWAQDEKCSTGTTFYAANELLDRTLNKPQSPRVFAADSDNSASKTPPKEEVEGRRVLSSSQMSITVKRDAGISDEDWKSIFTIGAAETERKKDISGINNKPIDQKPIGVFIRDKSDSKLSLSVLIPENPTIFFPEVWRLVPVVCSSKTGIVLAYSVVTVSVVSKTLAWSISLGGLAIFWILITYATWQLNHVRLDNLAKSELQKQLSQTPSARQIFWYKILLASNPVFISQDSLGYGSLSRFQILIFTTAVGTVLLYVFVHSGALSPMSTTILLLLGITVAGGTFARSADDWGGISQRSRQFLIGKEILKIRRDDKPRISDLFETQGEVDVAKVQALMFTALVAISILSSTLTGLGNFDLPEQIVYLTGISQGAYVLGKLMPAGTRTRLEQDLSQLRNAAASLRGNPKDTQSQSLFDQAKQTALSTLAETYLDRFNPERFIKIPLEDI